MIRSFGLILLMFLPVLVYSQNIISGHVYDNSQKPISRVTVTYSKVNSTIVSGFTQTDQNGYFRLAINSTEDSILLSLKHISYEGKLQRLKNITNNHSFTLNQQAKLLSTVVISAPPIYKRNDTINYRMDSFTSKEDRVIGDIIKKLPGVEMDGDKILYQGKPIQKYFINGLDLLENRYGIANNNLPVEAVKKVQIIENDQPIKILDSLVFSDRASLNIQLKKLTTTGTAKTGVGLQPALWDVNLTPMTFSKNFQTINTYQTNNVGDNVSRQLNSLVDGNAFEVVDQSDLSGMPPLSFLNIQEIASPAFNEKKWLDNHTSMFSSNMLQKLKNNIELKASISYVNDYQRRTGRMYTTLFTPDQNIDFSEIVANAYRVNDLRGDFILLKNEKDVYLKNNLQVSRKWNNDSGRLFRNDIDTINQNKSLQDFSLSNRFTAVRFFGKQLLTLNSFLNLSQTPQSLTVTPGQFEYILHDSLPYKKVRQDVQFRNLTMDNYVSFVKGIKRFSLIPKIGVFFQSQTLQNQLSIKANESTNVLGDDFTDSMQFYTTETYVDLKTQYKNRKWKIDVNLPLKLRHFLIQEKPLNNYPEENGSNLNYPLTKLTIEPRGVVIYSFNEYLEFRATTAYAKQFGSINTLYNTYLLTSY